MLRGFIRGFLLSAKRVGLQAQYTDFQRIGNLSRLFIQEYELSLLDIRNDALFTGEYSRQAMRFNREYGFVMMSSVVL